MTVGRAGGVASGVRRVTERWAIRASVAVPDGSGLPGYPRSFAAKTQFFFLTPPGGPTILGQVCKGRLPGALLSAPLFVGDGVRGVVAKRG